MSSNKFEPVPGFIFLKDGGDEEEVKEEKQQQKTTSESADEGEKKPPEKLKPCCACPETRKKRDECIVENGEENCTEYIEAHKKCLRDLGFNI